MHYERSGLMVDAFAAEAASLLRAGYRPLLFANTDAEARLLLQHVPQAREWTLKGPQPGDGPIVANRETHGQGLNMQVSATLHMLPYICYLTYATLHATLNMQVSATLPRAPNSTSPTLHPRPSHLTSHAHPSHLTARKPRSLTPHPTTPQPSALSPRPPSSPPHSTTPIQ